MAKAPDDAAAKATVLQLVEELGCDAVDAGSLADSWREQPGTPGYVHDFDEPRTRAALAEADHGKLADYRHASNEWLRKLLGA